MSNWFPNSIVSESPACAQCRHRQHRKTKCFRKQNLPTFCTWTRKWQFKPKWLFSSQQLHWKAKCGMTQLGSQQHSMLLGAIVPILQACKLWFNEFAVGHIWLHMIFIHSFIHCGLNDWALLSELLCPNLWCSQNCFCHCGRFCAWFNAQIICCEFKQHVPTQLKQTQLKQWGWNWLQIEKQVETAKAKCPNEPSCAFAKNFVSTNQFEWLLKMMMRNFKSVVHQCDVWVIWAWQTVTKCLKGENSKWFKRRMRKKSFLQLFVNWKNQVQWEVTVPNIIKHFFTETPKMTLTPFNFCHRLVSQPNVWFVAFASEFPNILFCWTYRNSAKHTSEKWHNSNEVVSSQSQFNIHKKWVSNCCVRWKWERTDVGPSHENCDSVTIFRAGARRGTIFGDTNRVGWVLPSHY